MLFAIKNLRASRVNLLMNDFAAGLPSPLSILGLGDAVVRDLGLTPWSARTLPVLHRVYVSQRRTKPEMENKSDVFTPIETMEDLTGTVEVSVLLDLPGYDNDIEVRNSLYGRRIAGGTIQNEEIRVETVTRDGSVFRKLSRGYAMIRPETRERRMISTGSQKSLAAIATLLFPAERPPGFGLVVPVAVGHHFLEDPDSAPKRIRTRCRDVPHVFTEPVLGIAELISVRNERLTKLGEESLDELLWSWTARGEYVLGHPAYHPEIHDSLKDVHHA